MAETVVKENKITSNEFSSISKDMVLDLTAFFNQFEEEVIKMLGKAKKEHWTPDELITKISKLI